MGADKLLGLLKNFAKECMRVEAAKKNGSPEVILGHLCPQVMSVPGRNQVLDTGDSFHRVQFGIIGRDLETHGLDQVVVEGDE